MASLNEPLVIKFKRLHENAKIPTKANSKDAGWDLYAVTDETIYPGDIWKVPVGIAVSIPTGYVGVIMGRSSLGGKGIDVLGGVIDSGYIGEISVILNNRNEYSFSKDEKGQPEFTLNITKGNKIAQMLILPVPDIEFVEVDTLEETERGAAGFGSSGL